MHVSDSAANSFIDKSSLTALMRNLTVVESRRQSSAAAVPCAMYHTYDFVTCDHTKSGG